jgi:ABC-type polar amino acid transport system ATPase subunit
VIEIDALRKSFGAIEVLKGMSLSFADGEVVSVLGPSGSGKSTLIRCINGLEAISAGDIRVDGLSVREKRNVPEVRKHCAMVFQQFNLYPHLTALQNITLAPIRVLKLPKAEAEGRAMALLERVALADRAKSYPSEMSGGQQQRIGICRALAMQPRHLLLDEVTSALDPEMTSEVLDVIAGLARSGTTMILVTHEIDFARRVSDRIVFLDDGQVAADDTVANFFSGGQNERIERFLNKMKH